MVIAGAAPDFVVASASVELVIAGVTLDRVVAQPAGDHVIVGPTFQSVAVAHTLGQADLVIARAAAQCASYPGQAKATDQDVIAGAGVCVDNHPTQSRGIDDVIARAGVDHHFLDP